MIAVVAGILSLTVLGIPVALAIERGTRPLCALGLGFLYGSGLAYGTLLMLSPLGWTLPRVATAMLIVTSACLMLMLRAPRPEPAAARELARGFALPDLLTLVTLAGFACWVTLAPLWEWDFWAIWGLKARVFAERGAIDWRFLESPWNLFAHTDYPLLLPLDLDFFALAGGAWDDRWLGLFFVAFAAALVLIVRDLAADELTPNGAAAVALAVAAVACARRAGTAEGPLIALGSAAILMLRRAILHDDDAALRHGAILLGLAACTKNEGQSLVVAVMGGMLAAGAGRRIVRLWPAAALLLPWIVLRALHRLPTDLFSGSPLPRVLERFRHFGPIGRSLVAHLANPWLFIVSLLVLLLVRDRGRERFVRTTLGIQTAIFLAIYLETPNDVFWQISTSWQRVSAHLLVPLTFSAAMVLGRQKAEGRDEGRKQKAEGRRASLHDDFG